MSDANREVLDYLREQFARLHTKMDRIIDDVADLKSRMTGVELELGRLSVRVAETNARIDRIEVRLDRIERRLDLVEDAP
jgi:predicted  nucleic acid-binding Zn-ribbon protein